MPPIPIWNQIHMAEELESLDEEFHAQLSPSSSERWIPCPGSVQAQLQVPNLKDDTNEHSRLGTAAHALLQIAFVTSRPPEHFIGAQLVDQTHPRVDEDMCDWVRVGLDYVYEYIDIHGADNLIVLPETRVFIGGMLGITGNKDKDDMLCNGTADFIIAHKNMSMCAVLDYKNGKNRVNAEENSQTMLYGVGASARFGKFKRYRSVIVQPRAGKRNPVDEWEYTVAQQKKFIGIAANSAWSAMQPNAPRVAGPQCSWCKAAPRCRTYKDKTWAKARVEFAPIDDEPDPELLTEAELAEVLEWAPFIKGFLNKVEAHVQKMLQNDPKAVPGFALGWGRRERKWQDIDGVVSYCESIGMKLDEFMPRQILSPAEMQKAITRYKKATLQIAGKRKRSEKPLDFVEPFVTYSVPPVKVQPVVRNKMDLEAIEDVDI